MIQIHFGVLPVCFDAKTSIFVVDAMTSCGEQTTFSRTALNSSL